MNELTLFTARLLAAVASSLKGQGLTKTWRMGSYPQRAFRAASGNGSPFKHPFWLVLQVEDEGGVLDGGKLPPRRSDTGSTLGRCDGHPVHRDQLFQVQSRQLGDVPDGRSERAQRWNIINNPTPGHVGQVGQMRGLVPHILDGRQLSVVNEHGELEEAQRDLHAPVHRIEGAEIGR